MNHRRLISRAFLACFAVVLMESLQPREAVAEWFRSLHAGQSAWIRWSLEPGDGSPKQVGMSCSGG